MEFVKPLEPLDVADSNVYQRWLDWKEAFGLFNLGSGLSSKEEKQQVSAMVSQMGLSCIKIYNRMTFPAEKSKEVMKDVQEKFNDYFKQKASKSSLRQIFQNRTQKQGVLDFVEDWRHRAG